MRTLILIITAMILVLSSCAGTNKRLKKNKKPAAENIAAAQEKTETAAPITEIEEKLVAIDEKLPDPHRYFVIIGSFRIQENAKKHQSQILRDGFSSELLKNEQGLFRVSVMGSDDINEARTEIRRIRAEYPEYYDTWLLIQKR